MKKTVLIISSVLLNVAFILMFIFLQSDKSDEQIKIDLLKDQLYLEQQKNKQYDEDFSKAEFNEDGNLKSQRLVGENEELMSDFIMMMEILKRKKYLLNLVHMKKLNIIEMAIGKFILDMKSKI